ncbi:MFS transporter [Pelagibius litoralis]|uniref:MFS transporter n=1 Tax=Pelagibius litoralis TaxID=374515 RepID=A0A967F2B9_9PROT|nr:MFS transporter [Pelagibius litoralis]NIA71631.1 MFS transporter [Pelagibius litoralis]
MTTPLKARLQSWQRPEVLLLLMAASVPLSFATWQALLNNFAIERAAFTGAEIGILQSLREVPGFLAFGVVFLLLAFREQRLAYLSLLLLGLGTAVTGAFPTVIGLYITTVVMSLGYHYYETLQISLSLQWIDKEKAPETLGRIIAVGSFASIVVFGLIWLTSDILALDYFWIYAIGGGVTALVALVAWLGFPTFPQEVEQHKHLVLRKRYWLYYALTFLSGARRQIFVVFAGFLMVEKFGYDVGAIALLFLLNAAINVWLAPKIGRLIGRIGERRALIFEYIGLIGVFVAYAFVEDATVAAGLYVVDHLFFALAIAIKTYFQKIADPADIASTAGVSFTINHIAAVFLPAAFGFLWLVSPAAVFLSGAALAAGSLLLALNVPRHPQPGEEVLVGRIPLAASAAAE